jgi:hypothetical protein
MFFSLLAFAGIQTACQFQTADESTKSYNTPEKPNIIFIAILDINPILSTHAGNGSRLPLWID